jgi:hypothetical protein
LGTQVRARALGLAGLAALVLGGCGSGPSSKIAAPQVVRLGWHENCGTRTERLPITTRRLVVGKGRWRVDLAFRNEMRVALSVVRPHHPGQTWFGLEPFRTTSLQEVRNRATAGSIHVQTIADRFNPSRPALISPGQGWSGSFSGPGDLPAGVPIRVVLGAFLPPGPIDDRFLCISERAIRLR